MSTTVLRLIGILGVAAIGAIAYAIFLSDQDAPEQIWQSECRDAYRWSAYRLPDGEGATATFAACEVPADYITFRCRAGSDTVKITIKRKIAGLSAGASVTAALSIGDKVFDLNGTARPVADLGAPIAVLSAAKTDPVFAALTRQGEGALTVAGQGIPFHAFGSFHPVVKMIEAC